MQCLILAGGLGTRMRPFTEGMPKALIPAHGVPFVDFQLGWLKAHGVTDVILSIGYRGEMLREHVGDGWRFGVPVRYVDEGTDLRGTAGALRLALAQGVLAESFLVTYGDSFLPVDFAAINHSFVNAREPAMMTVLHNGGRWDTSNVVFANGRLELYDKRRADRPVEDYQFIDYGLTGLRRSVVETMIPEGQKYDLADVFHDLSVRGDLLGIEVTPRFYEIGSPAGLADFSDWVKDAKEKGELGWAPAHARA